MKIFLLTDADVFAGTERHVLDLARGLARLGHAPVIGCPAGTPLAQRAAEFGIAHHPLPKRSAVDPRLVLELARLLRGGASGGTSGGGGVSLIHAHNGRSALHGALAKALAGRGRLVLTQHFISPARSRRRGPVGMVSRAVHRWVARRIDHTIAISTAVRDAALARGDAPADRVTVVFNGTGDPADQRRTPVAQVRQSLGLPPGGSLVACAARLQPEKGLDKLVEAMGRVVRDRPGEPGVRCVIAGQGSERGALEARIQSAGLGGQVVLLGFRPDVREILAAADVVVLPAPAEPFGLVLIEAMALGRPVVATAAGGPVDIVADGETGVLTPAGDAGALAEALVGLLSDPDRAEAMGRAGRGRFESHFTTQRMARATAAVYGRAVGARGAGSVLVGKVAG